MSELEDLREEIARLRSEKADAVATLTAWFDIQSLAAAQITPEFVKAVRGYLRTSRNGGMPKKQSDMIENVLEDFARLYLVQSLWPVLIRLAAEHKDGLAVPEHMTPKRDITDDRLLAAVSACLDETPKMPVNVSDMNDHDRQFFAIISKQSGTLLFLRDMLATRIRTA